MVLITDKMPENIVQASKKLTSTSIDLVSIGFNKKVTDKLWFYIYDEDIFASRVYSPSIKSSNTSSALAIASA
jgi:protoporphyrinogen oxidase